MNYELTCEQKIWAASKKQGVAPSELKKLIRKQKGRCALSKVELRFNKQRDGTPGKGKGKGCHPLYAAVDHIFPKEKPCQLVCYDLNDLKGHLPYKIFKDLKRTKSWRELMKKWRRAARTDPENISAFKFLLKDPKRPLKGGY